MHWLFLLLGFAAMVVAFKTTSTGLMAFCLLAALVLFVMWLAGLYSARMGGRSRDASLIMDPAELHLLRKEAEARKAAAAVATADAQSDAQSDADPF